MHKNFVVYKSSAGSGKTFTLVKEYLRIALSENSDQPQLFRKILAVTFTNKAATEMKDRITDTLRQMSDMDEIKPPLMATLLSEELQVNVETLRVRSKSLLSQILHNYSDFSIGTIDSFTHKIIKSFAFDLKLPVNFNVETDTEDFYSKVVSALIAKVGENENLTQLLKDFSISNAGADSSWDPEPGLLNFTSALKKEDAHIYLQQLRQLEGSELKNVDKKLKDKIREFQKFLKEKSNEALELIRSKHLTDSNFHYAKSGPQNFFRKCNDLEFDSLEDLIGSRIKDAVINGKWNNKTNSSSENSALESIVPKLNQIAGELIAYCNQHYKSYALYSLLEKNIHALLLVNELQTISDEFKQEEQIIFISEFNEKISKVVADEPAPFIYERLGERYQHFLIDEFQDTSSLQWQNILPLLDNSLANGKFNLIVGDGKQSIYRWRNANVNQFNSLPLIEASEKNPLLQERQSGLQRNYEEKILNTNFRSLPRIIDFNNSFFDLLPAKILSGDLQSIYHHQSQGKKHSAGGYISVDSGILDREELNEKNKQLILQYIGSALSSGFTYNDICVIVRGNDKGNTIATFLVEQSLPVISSESLLLKNAPEIACVISFLKALSNAEDKINAASVITYVCAANNRKHELPIHLKSLRTADLCTVLKDLTYDLTREQLAQKNIFDACVEIINAFGLHSVNPQYIRFFLDEVNEYLVNKSASLTDFLNWWEKRKETASVIIPEGMNAVRIMTIHKSKGLEFPIVIMPFTNWETFKTQQDWIHINDEDIKLPVALFNISNALSNAGLGHVMDKEKEQQYLDNLNLLYVGFTRAVERLHIISYKSKTQKRETVAEWINLFMNESKAAVKDGKAEWGILEKKRLENKEHTLDIFSIDELQFCSNPGIIKIKGSHLLNVQYETQSAREKGIKMHFILSQIYSQKDIDSVLEKMLQSGLIVSEEKDELKEKISSLLKNPLLENYYSETLTIKNEAELVTENREILRPDRIVLEENSAVVIDYKTGKENKSYLVQMNKYEQALNSMGINPVKKILVYIEENRAEELA